MVRAVLSANDDCSDPRCGAIMTGTPVLESCGINLPRNEVWTTSASATDLSSPACGDTLLGILTFSPSKRLSHSYGSRRRPEW
eukprot:1550843-Alexandrium_andersonii.AAC.1